MQTYKKKQIQIICERPILKRVQRSLEQLAVRGYTVIPALAGSGSEGGWDREGMVGDAGQMVMIVVILDQAELDRVLDGVFAIVSTQVGVIAVSDVEVVRPDRF